MFQLKADGTPGDKGDKGFKYIYMFQLKITEN